MGLILTTLTAASSTLRDQWKEYFYCDAIPSDTICVRAHKKTKGANWGDDNVISDGSVIAVADGQCMIIVEQGAVVDICAEPGEYTYNNQTAPSLLAGDSLSSSIKEVFNAIGKRFTFGGDVSSNQRVYFFNTKEITGLKYGTASPVPFRVVDQRAGIDIDISVKAFGEYSIKVSDPILFYTNVCANVSDSYKVAEIQDQMRSELLTALQPAFAKLSAQSIRYSEIPAHTSELADELNAELSKKWKDGRGIEIVSFGVSSIKANEEDEAMLKGMQRDAAYTNASLAGAALVGAQAHAMKDAANNANGAAAGFVGLNMAQNAGGANVQSLFNMQAQASNVTNSTVWKCPNCGQENKGNFCTECGTKRTVVAGWECPNCHTANTGNFCTQCGTKRPA